LGGVGGGASASPVLEPELFVVCELAREFVLHGDVCMLVSMRGSANVHSCPGGKQKKKVKRKKEKNQTTFAVVKETYY